MNLKQIKQAVDSGRTVHWASDAYCVIRSKFGEYLIGYDINGPRENYIGLTWRDGVTLNGQEHQFYEEAT